MTWVNVDKPTGKCTIHPDDGCVWVTTKSETPKKGIGKLRSDGGWLSFETDSEAEDWCSRNFPGYSVTTCPYCETIPREDLIEE